MASSQPGEYHLVILLLVLVYVVPSNAISETPRTNATKTHKPPVSPAPAPKPLDHRHSNSSDLTPAAAPKPLVHRHSNSSDLTPAAAPKPLVHRHSNSSAGAPAAAPAPAKGKGPSHRPTNGTLDPAQVKALQLLGVTVEKDACNTDVQELLICDTRTPFRHLIALQLQYCPSNVALSKTAFSSLGTLQSLSFVDCPMRVAPLPLKLLDSLESLSCIQSLGRTEESGDLPALPGIWLSSLRGLKELTVKDVVVNASKGGVGAIIGSMSRLQEITLSNANVSGSLPKSWPGNLTTLVISRSMVKGNIPSSISNLTQLETLDFSFNNLSGKIPGGVASLKNLQMLSLNNNRLSGGIPRGFKNLTLLSYLDLSDNQFNGTVPSFIATIKGLRYLDLSNNKFHGVLPFTTAFVKNLNTFKVGSNPELCFNDSVLLSSISGGADPCDSKGRPSKGGADSPAYDAFSPSPAPSDEMERPHHKKKGPKTVVLAVSIALASLVLVIIIAVVLSRWCARRD